MKKDSFKLIIMSVAVICIVIAGIMVPGIVLEANQKSEHDHVAKVPKSYLPSGSVMAKEASVNLKLSEKLSLIDGQWDSTTDDAASYEMDEQDYQAVATCRKSIEKLYEEKLYPVNLSPDYSNWYTWEAAAKKASDNTFNTYTAYYWIIRFEKYDGTQNHTIWMLEDGTIIMAKAHMKDISDMSEYKEVLHADDESQAENDLSAYKGYFDYSGIDFSKLNLISETTAVEQKIMKAMRCCSFYRKMNMYMRSMRSDIDPVCISMCRPGFYNKNAMYDTKSLQLTYILIITTWKITILNSHRERKKGRRATYG